MGHVMRQAAVAEAAAASGHEARLIGEVPEAMSERLRRWGIDVATANGDSWLRNVRSDDVIVFDGYDFGPDDHEAAAITGATLGAVEDSGRGRYLVDVVLNQNLVGDVRLETRTDTHVLLGPRYALVREAFRSHRRQRGDDLDQVVVILGGSNAAGLLERVAGCVAEQLQDVVVTCVVGPTARAVTVEHPDVRLIRNPDEIAVVFDGADAAVTAAGSTTWELLCMGLPTVLIQVADNQEHVGQPVADRGAALFAGRLPLDENRLSGCLEQLSDSDVRGKLSQRGLDLVDGLGPDRFIGSLLQL